MCLKNFKKDFAIIDKVLMLVKLSFLSDTIIRTNYAFINFHKDAVLVYRCTRKLCFFFADLLLRSTKT